MTLKLEDPVDCPITPPGATITRRGFVKMGGALFVSLTVPAGLSAEVAKVLTPHHANQLNPTLLASWLEIHSDNTILARTGRAETGTGMSAYYAQMIAEELNVRPEAITLVLGDTDRTPDGGPSAGFLWGAFTYQALLALASSQLGEPVSGLTAVAGIVSGGGKTISYGQLVQGQHLD